MPLPNHWVSKDGVFDRCAACGEEVYNPSKQSHCQITGRCKGPPAALGGVEVVCPKCKALPSEFTFIGPIDGSANRADRPIPRPGFCWRCKSFCGDEGVAILNPPNCPPFSEKDRAGLAAVAKRIYESVRKEIPFRSDPEEMPMKTATAFHVPDCEGHETFYFCGECKRHFGACMWSFSATGICVECRDKPVRSCGFEAALSAIKAGKKAARSGWNGKGMYVYRIPAAHVLGDEEVVMQSCLVMRTAEDKHQPGWLASQADLLSEDWEILP